MSAPDKVPVVAAQPHQPNGPATSYGFQQPGPNPHGAPPPGYGPPPAYAQPGYGPGQPAQPAQAIYVGQNVPQTVILGGCPACQQGVLQDTYSCAAIFLAIFFFPIGILCCLAMQERQCTRCGARF